MINKIKTWEEYCRRNPHVNDEWVLKYMMKEDPLLFKRNLKIDKIISRV